MWLLALVAIQVVSSSVGVKEISSFRLPGTESQRAYDLLAEHFPAAKGDTDQLVYRARSGRLTDGGNRFRISQSLKQLRRNKDVASVASPFGGGGRLTKDGRIGVATLNYKESTNDIKPGALADIQDIAFGARSSAVQVEHGGPGAEVVRFSESQGPSEGIGVLAAAVVLLFTFGSLVAAGLPLIATLLALGCAIGVITLISHLVDTPDFATQLATLIGLGVGIDYSLFVVTRFRAEVRAGLDRDAAIEKAIDTAGRTVMFAGITVVIALLGLLLLGLSFMHGVALGAAAAVLAVMLSALTIVPALIGGAGPFMDGVLREFDRRGGFRFWGMKRRIHIPGESFRARRAAKRERRATEGSGWERWSRAVQRRPWPAAILSILLLVALALPALNLRLGSSDAGVDPSGTTTRKAYDLIAEGFGAGTNGSFLLVVELPHKGDVAAAHQVESAVKRDRDFTFVSPPAVSPDGRVATITAYPRTGPQDKATTDTLERLRDDVLPAVERRTDAAVEVGGFTASTEDFSRVVASKLPLFIGVVVLLSALLLLVVFRSVVIPIKAALMNLLSIGAALGFVTLIFQEGHGADLLGIGTGPIESFVPVLMFAIVFGLSMDYEVFLISRVHEEWVHTGDASTAVGRGLQTTGRVITAAASIMVVVFGSFAIGDDRIIKLFGIGLASAVFFDAVIIRCLLVPALMELFGRRAWWLPAWLDRRLPRLAIEAPHEDT
ncbi:MAG: putative drug exporter of the superfamily, partial [Thermoleophilaceae bacterium]|nr:putative drug exporter of the superfamily [Thermoleophilaceae bacterium]